MRRWWKVDRTGIPSPSALSFFLFLSSFFRCCSEIEQNIGEAKRRRAAPVDKLVRYGNRTGSSCEQPLKNPVAGDRPDQKTGFAEQYTANITKKGLTHPCLAASFVLLVEPSPRVNRFAPFARATIADGFSFRKNVRAKGK